MAQFDSDMKKMLPVDSNKNLLSLDELFKDTDKGDGANQKNAGQERDKLMGDLDTSPTKDQAGDFQEKQSPTK